MKIDHIKISNILGIEEIEFTPSGFNQISGQNGTGKTSILEAIKSVFAGGTDATLLRKGAEKGEIVLVLDDGTEIHKRVTQTRSVTDVTQDGKKITRPSDAIKALTDALSVNPVDFLRATKKDRVKVLLESMPIKIDTEYLTKISGVNVSDLGGANGLAIIDAVRQQVYEDRTGTNRAVKEKDATINQLTLAMPDAPGGVEGDEDELRAKLEEARAKRIGERERIDDKLGKMRQDSQAKIQTLKDEANAKIEAIRVEVSKAVADEQAAFAVVESKATNAKGRADDAFTEIATPLEVAISAIVRDRDMAAKRTQTKSVIDNLTKELEQLQADSKAQTEAIDAIDDYKLDLLSKLPIAGIEIKDGDVYRDGVQFDRLNTAQQVEIAFKIAKLRAGDLACCCLDGLELLDSDHLAELESQAAESGMQVFLTRVSDGEFAVETK